MKIIDTHSHLYLAQFAGDLPDVIRRAEQQQVCISLLPNIDSVSVIPMLEVCAQFPNHCKPMIGLHPTHVKDNFEDEYKKVFSYFDPGKFVAIGEIGVDLYWDNTYAEQQCEVFRRQLNLAVAHDLPVVIHSRNSFNVIYDILRKEYSSKLRGVFHAYSSSLQNARKVIDMGFMLGIGGVLTYKNCGLAKILPNIDLMHIVLETDAPFLPPHPHRGQRNEPAYLEIIARKVAEIKSMSLQEVAEITTANANVLFNLT